MQQKHVTFVSVLSFFSVLSIISFFGCGSGGGGGSVSTRTGGITGRLASGPDGKTVPVYGAIPAGFTPVTGASVSVTGVGSTTSGVDGTFSLPKVPAGSQTLKINPPTGTASTVAVTVIPDAAIRTGDPPITRDAAVTLVKQALTADDILLAAGIWSPKQPLPAGVKIESTLWFGDVAGPMTSTTSAQWLVYVDPTPMLRFGHDVFCYFVDAETGTLTKLVSDSWPSVNGYAYYRPISSGAPVSADEVKAPPSRVSRSMQQPLYSDYLRSLSSGGRSATGKTYALLVRGASSLDTKPDIDVVKKLFGTSPIPAAAEVDVIDTLALPTGTNPSSTIVNHFNSLAAKTKAGDTFVLFVSSHGIISRKPGGQGGYIPPNLDYHIPLEGNPGGKFLPTSLDFKKMDACNIVIIADTCYSGMWIELLKPQLSEMTGKHIVVLTSANYKRGALDSRGTDTITVGGKDIVPPAGGAYTQSLGLGFLGGFDTADLYADLSIAHSKAVLIVKALTDFAYLRYRSPPFQDPQIWQRTVGEGEGCFGESITVRSGRIKR